MMSTAVVDSMIDPSTSQSLPNQRRTSNSLNSRSCITCRRRKVKCDKQNPCSNCARAGSPCVFPAPGRAPRRPRAIRKVMSEREAELLKRLRRLEGVVEELSGQVELEGHIKNSPLSDNSSSNSPEGLRRDSTVRVVGMDEGSGNRDKWMKKMFRIGDGPPKTAFSEDELYTGIGRLVLDKGKSKYLASPFWASITDEMSEIREALHEQEFDSDSDCPIVPSDMITDSDHQSFIMGYNSSNVDLTPLHPPQSQIPLYWQAYLDSVHPLIKVLHAPTMNKVMKEVQHRLDNLSKSTEALMFAIYFATVTSMTTQEVYTSFGIEKDTLRKQFRFGVEQALAKAGFLNTHEIVTLQALVLFLTCVRRHDDSRFAWSITGLAIRIAQCFGLHRDGTNYHLSPFDVEMRRRLWWEVCILDKRASEDLGSEPGIIDLSFDTALPSNLNDDDLDPEATEAPLPRQGVTEMTFSLLRFELTSLSHKISYVPRGVASGKLTGQVTSNLEYEEKEKMILEFSQHLETTYLQYCRDAGPICWAAATTAQMVIAKTSLLLYHPFTQPGKPNNLPRDIKDRLFIASIETIEHARAVEREATATTWGWLLHTYIPWHAIAYILSELCIRDPSEMVDRAWRAIDDVCAHWTTNMRPKMKGKESGVHWVPMRKLMLRARRKREEQTRLNLAGTLLGQVQTSPEILLDSCSNISPHSMLPPSTDAIRTASSPSRISPKTLSANGFPLIQNSNHEMLSSAFTDEVEPHLQTIGAEPKLEEQQGWLSSDLSHIDSADMNLDMGVIEWEGWDEMVKDFQVSENTNEISRYPMLGVSAWW